MNKNIFSGKMIRIIVTFFVLLVAGFGFSSSPILAVVGAVLVIRTIWSNSIDVSIRSKQWAWVLAILVLVAVVSLQLRPNAYTLSVTIFVILLGLYMSYRAGFTKSPQGWYEELYKIRWYFYGISLIFIIAIPFLLWIAFIGLQSSIR